MTSKEQKANLCQYEVSDPESDAEETRGDTKSKNKTMKRPRNQSPSSSDDSDLPMAYRKKKPSINEQKVKSNQDKSASPRRSPDESERNRDSHSGERHRHRHSSPSPKCREEESNSSHHGEDRHWRNRNDHGRRGDDGERQVRDQRRDGGRQREYGDGDQWRNSRGQHPSSYRGRSRADGSFNNDTPNTYRRFDRSGRDFGSRGRPQWRGRRPRDSSEYEEQFGSNESIQSNRIAEQMQKRKLLWQGAKEKTSWEAMLAACTDEKQAEKLKKMIGLRGDHQPSTSAGDHVDADNRETATETRRQEEIARNLQQQYEVARMSTHTHRGMGLGFTSQWQTLVNPIAKEGADAKSGDKQKA